MCSRTFLLFLTKDITFYGHPRTFFTIGHLSHNLLATMYIVTCIQLAYTFCMGYLQSRCHVTVEQRSRFWTVQLGRISTCRVENSIRCPAREHLIVGNLNFPQLSSAAAPHRSVPHFSVFRAHATPRPRMVKLDLDQILETTETIVQELLATGEFG